MEYIKKLKEFTGVTEIQGEEEKIKHLKPQFKNLAEYFLTKGHLLINGKCGRKVYICDVEFYYHEEFEGGIKDWIMYHRNHHPKKKTKELGYLEVGQLNSHESGIDITFENKAKQYRAGMLIRGFKIVEETNDTDLPMFDYHPKAKYDDRSTHFYDALINSGNILNGFTIKWEEENRECKLEKEPIYRKNVAAYDIIENEQSELLPVKIEFNKEEHTGKNDKKCESSKYKQCMRPWRYKLETVSV